MTLPGVSAKLYFFLQVIQNCLQLEPRVLSNFEFTYTSAGNLHTQVLANAILPIYRFAVNIFPLQKTMKNEI